MRNSKQKKTRSKTPPNLRGSKIPTRSKERRGSDLDSNERKIPLKYRSISSTQSSKQASQTKKSATKKGGLLPSTANDRFSLNSEANENNNNKNKFIQKEGNQVLEMDSDTDQILKAVTKSQINQSPVLGKLESALISLESDSVSEGPIERVEQQVQKIASNFGSTEAMTNFLAKTKEIKLFMNPANILPIKELFEQMENEMKQIKIQSKLPSVQEIQKIQNPALAANGSFIIKRLESMKQARTCDLAMNFLQNEFDRFNAKTEKLLSIKTAELENLQKENTSLNNRIIELQRSLSSSDPENNLLLKDNVNDGDRPKLISQIKDMMAEINKKKEMSNESTKLYSDKMTDLADTRNKLIQQYISANQKLKRLEESRRKLLDSGMKIVNINGKDYDLKKLDGEVLSLFDQKEQILKGFEKLEVQERRFLATLKSCYK